jgi:nucleoside 2-deoxyribosyltransferase
MTKENKNLVFYSWQSDLDKKTNQGAIRGALNKASADLGKSDYHIVIDEATSNQPGSPNIPETILRKIQQSDIFVADVSFVDTPSNPKRLSNPNVIFELGYAVAYLGWERIILVFNEYYGSVTDLPFDFDRHRALVYKVTGKDDKNGISQLDETITEALKLIIDNNQEKRYLSVEQSEEQVKRQRDLVNLKWLLSQVHLGSLDNLLMYFPDKISSKSIHFWEGYNVVYSSRYFHLYDKKLESLVTNLHTAWEASFGYYHCYTTDLQGDSMFDHSSRQPNRQSDYDELKTIGKDFSKSLNQLLKFVRENYIEIDVEATSKSAWQDYLGYQL